MALRQSIRARPYQCHASKATWQRKIEPGVIVHLQEKAVLKPLSQSMRRLARMRCESAHRIHSLTEPASGSCAGDHSHELGHERYDLKVGVGHSQSCGEFRKANLFGCTRAAGIVVENATIAIVDDAGRCILRCSMNGLRALSGTGKRICIFVLCAIVHDHDRHDP